VDIRENIFNTISDLVLDLMYYDRKEDETLPRGDIEKAVHNKYISIDEMVSEFRENLVKALEAE